MAIEVRSTGSQNISPYVRALIVGQPGVGKSSLVTEFPNPVWASAAAGLESVARLGNFPYIDIDSELSLHQLKLALDQNPSDREGLFGFPVETLVVDTVDELQRVLLLNHLKKQGRTDTKPEDWGWIANRMHSIFAALTSLDLNVVFIAHTKEVQIGDEVHIKPAIQGQFCEAIHSYVDYSLLMKAAAFEEPKADFVQVENDEATYRVELSGDSTDYIDSRYLVTRPLDYAEWISDASNTLPRLVQASDFCKFIFDSRVVNLSQVDDVVVDPDQPIVVTQETDEKKVQYPDPVVPSNVDCESCGSLITEQVYIDLSRAQLKETLCGSCYKEKVN